MSLDSEFRDDIDRSFERLIQGSSLNNKKETLATAKDYLDEQLSRDYPDSIKERLKRGKDLINKFDNDSDKQTQQVILAALEYLIDPWDIIPDFIAEKGLSDDIYVIDKAFNRLKSVSKEAELKSYDNKLKFDPEKVMQELGEAGHHLSLRAYKLNLLDKYQRTALHDITRDYLNDYHLSRKQKVYYAVMIEKLVEDGILEKNCPDQPCRYCSNLKKLSKEV